MHWLNAKSCPQIRRVNKPLSSKTKCDQNHIAQFKYLVTPMALVKHNHLFNKPASVYTV